MHNNEYYQICIYILKFYVSNHVERVMYIGILNILIYEMY